MSWMFCCHLCSYNCEHSPVVCFASRVVVGCSWCCCLFVAVVSVCCCRRTTLSAVSTVRVVYCYHFHDLRGSSCCSTVSVIVWCCFRCGRVSVFVFFCFIPGSVRGVSVVVALLVLGEIGWVVHLPWRLKESFCRCIFLSFYVLCFTYFFFICLSCSFMSIPFSSVVTIFRFVIRYSSFSWGGCRLSVFRLRDTVQCIGSVLRWFLDTVNEFDGTGRHLPWHSESRVPWEIWYETITLVVRWQPKVSRSDFALTVLGTLLSLWAGVVTLWSFPLSLPLLVTVMEKG